MKTVAEPIASTARDTQLIFVKSVKMRKMKIRSCKQTMRTLKGGLECKSRNLGNGDSLCVLYELPKALEKPPRRDSHSLRKTARDENES